MKTKSKATPQLSASRQTLADLLAARGAILPVIRALEAQRDRLAELQKPDDGNARNLASLTASEAEAMASWSVTGQGKPPVANVKRRADLQRKIATANAASENARLASVSVVAQIDAESRRYASLAAPVQIAIIEVMIEDAEPEILAFERINADANARVQRITALGRMITDRAHAESDAETKAGLFTLNTRFFERINLIDARRRPDEAVGNAANAAWSALAVALDSDATATLSPKANKAADAPVDIAALAKKRLESLDRLERARH